MPLQAYNRKLIAYHQLVEGIVKQWHFLGRREGFCEKAKGQVSVAVVTDEGSAVAVHMGRLLHHFGVDQSELSSCIVSPIKTQMLGTTSVLLFFTIYIRAAQRR